MSEEVNNVKLLDEFVDPDNDSTDSNDSDNTKQAKLDKLIRENINNVKNQIKGFSKQKMNRVQRKRLYESEMKKLIEKSGSMLEERTETTLELIEIANKNLMQAYEEHKKVNPKQAERWIKAVTDKRDSPNKDLPIEQHQGLDFEELKKQNITLEGDFYSQVSHLVIFQDEKMFSAFQFALKKGGSLLSDFHNYSVGAPYSVIQQCMHDALPEYSQLLLSNVANNTMNAHMQYEDLTSIIGNQSIDSNLIEGCFNTLFVKTKLTKMSDEKKLIQLRLKDDPDMALAKIDDLVWLESRDEFYLQVKDISDCQNPENDQALKQKFSIDKDNGILVDYYTSTMKIDLETGSQYNINLLRTLRDSKHKNVFDTQIVKIIDYFWDQNFTIIVLNQLFYMLFGLLMFIDLNEQVIHKKDNETLQWTIFSICIILLLREFFTIISLPQVEKGNFGCASFIETFLDHFKDFRNFFDIAASTSYILFQLMDNQNQKKIQIAKGNIVISDIFHVIALFFGTYRGWISLFILFEKTRFMVDMVKSVVIQMIPFMLFMASALLLTSIMFMKLAQLDKVKMDDDQKDHPIQTKTKQKNGSYVQKNNNLAFALEMSFKLMFVDNNPKFNTVASFILFTIVSIFVVIIMLNLLISIISDVFERVESTKTHSDYSVRCRMLLEISQIRLHCSDKWNDKNMKYISYMVPEAAESTEQWAGKVQEVKKSVKKIRNRIFEMEHYSDQIVANTKGLDAKIKQKKQAADVEKKEQKKQAADVEKKEQAVKTQINN